MAISLADAIAGIGEQSGKSTLMGAAELNKSLANMAAAMDDSSSDTYKASKALQKSLEAMTSQAVDNIKQTKKLLQQDKISSRSANAAIKRQIKIIGELTESIEKESKSRELGRKDFDKMRKMVKEVSSGIGDEIQLIEAKVRGEKAAALERQVIARAEKREREQARREAQAAQRDRISRLSEGIEGRLGGAGAIGGAALGAARSKAGGLSGRKGVAAAGGVGILAILGGIFAFAQKQEAKALDAITGRFANYGLSQKTLNKELQVATKVLSSVEDKASKLGLDPEAWAQQMANISAQTGASAASLKKPMTDMMTLAKMGMGSMDELGGALVYQLNTVGESAEDANKSVKALAAIGRSLGGKNLLVQMDDFFKAINDITGSIGALSTNQENLARTMAVSFKVSEKLGLSYNRQLNAVKGLTQALTANEDTGFATISVREDLARLANSENATLRTQAGEIQKMLEMGQIHEVQAARMIKEIGGTTDPKLIANRMEQAVGAFRSGGLALVEAQFGQLNADQTMLLQQLSKEMTGGLDFESAMKAVETRTGKKAIDRFGKTVEERGDTPTKSLMRAMRRTGKIVTEKLIPMLGTVAEGVSKLNDVMERLTDFLGAPKTKEQQRVERIQAGNKGLRETIESLGGKRGFDAMHMAPEKTESFLNRMVTDPDMQAKLKERFKGDIGAANAEAIVSAMKGSGKSKDEITEALKAIGGEKYLSKAMNTAPEKTESFLKRMATDPGTQAKLKKRFKGDIGATNAEAVVSAMQGIGKSKDEIIEALKAIGGEKYLSKANIVGATLKGGKMGADGTAIRTMELQVMEEGAGDMARAASNMQNSQKRSSSRRGHP